jgi:hypothetical protein
MVTPTILYTSEFRIPFLERNPSELEKILQQFEQQPRKKLFELGILENEKYGQVILTPLGIVIIEKIKNILREVSKRYGFVEYGYVPLLDPQLLMVSGRYGEFKQDILHVNELSAILHPTAEEWFLHLFKNRRLKFSRAKDFLAVYHFVIAFRNTTPRRKPLRLQVFNVYAGYIIVSKASKELIENTLQQFFKDVWQKFNILKDIKTAISTSRTYVDFFIETQDGDDFYYKTDGNIYCEKTSIYDQCVRGTSVGMFAEFPSLSKKFGLSDYTIFTFAIGLERLLYAIYYGKGPSIPFIDLYIIPSLKSLKRKDAYNLVFDNLQYVIKNIDNFNSQTSPTVLIDDRKTLLEKKIKYAKLIGSKRIIKVNREEIIEIK